MTTLLAGALYVVISFVSVALDTASGGGIHSWRLAAWLASAVVAAAQIWYEHFRLTNRPRTIALHAAEAVALGAFGLAALANIHSGFSGPRSLLLALVTWPMITAIPAFVAAWAIAFVLARLSPRAPQASEL